MSNINELKPIISLNSFARFCCTIGNLPSSYMASLTYEEQLLWFCDYLQNTIIPAVNNNAEVVKELQELYVKLKNYVDNYFKNLDVQNEINNKLDEMAQDGTLENIINQEIFSNINNQIKNIENKINRKFIFIGDSYGTGYTEHDGTNKSWQAYVPEYLNLSVSDYYAIAHNRKWFFKWFNFFTTINCTYKYFKSKY